MKLRSEILNKRLKNIAEIYSGHLIPRKVNDDPNGNVRYIQMKDIDVECNVDVSKLSRVFIKKSIDGKCLLKNDILFKAKSNSNFACVIKKNFDNLIASAHFFTIRIKSNIIVPEYLAWFINQKNTQRFLKINSSGSTISVVTKKQLGELKVSIPSINNQEKIIKLDNLRKKEKELETKISELRRKIYNQKISNILRDIDK